jgi:hypothetical protein
MRVLVVAREQMTMERTRTINTLTRVGPDCQPVRRPDLLVLFERGRALVPSTKPYAAACSTPYPT